MFRYLQQLNSAKSPGPTKVSLYQTELSNYSLASILNNVLKSVLKAGLTLIS